MKKKVRLLIAAVILTISVVLLVWSYSPNPRETRIQNISPTEMILPAP